MHITNYTTIRTSWAYHNIYLIEPLDTGNKLSKNGSKFPNFKQWNPIEDLNV